MRVAALALALGCAAAAVAQPVADLVALPPDSTLAGTLGAGDGRLPSGEWMDGFVVASDGTAFEVRVEAEGFAPYLIVVAPGGAQQDVAPDGGPVVFARVGPQAAAAGPWVVRVTTAWPGETGAYRLTHRLRPELPLGVEVEGRLSVRDDTLVSGEAADLLQFVSDGRPFVVRLTSRAVDPYVFLTAPSGASIENDDDRGDETVAAAVVGPDRAEAGLWTVRATTFRPGEHGPYRLRADALPAAEAAAWSALADSLAGLDRLRPALLAALGGGRLEDAARRARGQLDRIRRLGPAAPRWAALADLATVLDTQGRLAEAESLYVAARADALVRYGSDHPAAVRIDANLGDVLRQRGAYAAADSVLTRAAEAVARARPPDHPDAALVLTNRAVLDVALGDVERAQGRLRRAVQIQEAAAGPLDETVGTILTTLGATLIETGGYSEARAVLDRALDALGPASGHPDLATVRASRGVLALRLGRFDEAEHELTAALALAEAAHGPDALAVAPHLANLGLLAQARGDVAAARRLLDRALAIGRAALPPTHPDLANALTGLALLLHDVGDAEQALPYAQEALRIREGALGPTRTRTLEARNNLAVVLYALGEIDGVTSELRRVVEDGAPALGLAHPVVAIAVSNRARIELLDGRTGDAADRLAALDAAQAAALGPRHPDRIRTLSALALARFAADDVAGALAVAVEARDLAIEAFGPAHALSIPAAVDAAFFTALDGDPDRAAALALDAGRAASTFAATVLPALSPAEQAAFTDRVFPDLTGFILTSRSGERAMGDAYDVLGGWKGTLLQGLRQQAAIARLADDPALAPAVGRLVALRAEVARAVQSGRPADALVREKEAAERALAQRLPGGALDDPWAAGGTAALQAALPTDAALVDVYRYRDGDGARAWRYAAIVVGPSGPPRFVALGPADGLDADAEDWLVRRADRSADAGALAEAVWGPIAAALPPGTARVWVAPDGRLARLPWSALARLSQSARRLDVAWTPSARALLRQRTAAPLPDAARVVVVGGVDYGRSPDGQAPPWAALEGTAGEARRVAAFARAAGLSPTVWSDSAATPSAVARGVEGASVVHLATHGVFGGPGAAGSAGFGLSRSRGPDLDVSEETGRRSRTPLSESGLALAGANRGPAGLLTAEELVGVDFGAARLVVLSACDTGRGAEVSGQGVLGLPAAVQAAGARAVLMSLWPVDDDATAVLMTAFYRGLWVERLAPAAALRRAQDEVRRRRAWAAPAFWAGWALTGDAF